MSNKSSDPKTEEPIITEGSFVAFLTILAQLVRDIETLRCGDEYDPRVPVNRLRYIAECAIRPVNQQQLSVHDIAYLSRTLGLFEELLLKPDQPLIEIDPPKRQVN